MLLMLKETDKLNVAQMPVIEWNGEIKITINAPNVYVKRNRQINRINRSSTLVYVKKLNIKKLKCEKKN